MISLIFKIETDLAQKILHEYQRVKDEIRDARMEYLKEETKVKIERVQSLDARYKRNRHVERGINDQQKVKKKLINFIEDQERKLEMTKRSDEMSSAKTDIQHFANKFMQPIKEKIHNRRIVAGENLLRRLVHTPTANSFDVKLSKHEYHPPSKLVLPKDKHTRDLLGLGFGVNDPLINKRPSESTKALKLSLNSPIFYKNPKNFAKFYSGGPQETEKDIFGVILVYIFNH